MAHLIAEKLDWEFVDATDLIRFNEDRSCNWEFSASRIHEQLSVRMQDVKGFVVPGFYGSNLDGNAVVTFPRSGSDITGGIIAAALDASEYQNWTDTDGLCNANPALVPLARSIPGLTYSEAQEATHGGVSALHPLALYPVERKGIPTLIRNTNNPGHPGTRISKRRRRAEDEGSFVMVTGKDGFSIITIAMPLMNWTLGFTHQVTGILLNHQVSLERNVDDANILTLAVDSKNVSDESLEAIMKEIQDCFPSATVNMEHDVALVMVIGEGMRSHVGAAMNVLGAFVSVGANIKLITQGASEISITFGISSYRQNEAIQAIHQQCFVPKPLPASLTYPA